MKLSGIFYAIAALMLGGIVLFVSLTKASLHVLAKEGMDNRANKVPLDIKITTDSGERIDCEYKVPMVNIRPGDPAYCVKSIRDKLWVTMTQDKTKKSKILLILADKRIAEFNVLINENKKELAYKSAEESLINLTEGYDILNKLKAEEKGETKEIENKYIDAGKMYERIIKEKTNNEAKNIIDKINIWNEERKKEIKN